MDLLQFFSAARLLVVAGKGGVGKTTVTAAVARAAADSGRSVLAVELEDKPALSRLLVGQQVQTITAPRALAEYLDDHGFGRVVRRLTTSGVIDVVSTAAPGIDDIVVLGKLKQLERSGAYDLIVVDGPAAGHAITFLFAPLGLLGAVRGGPIHDQAVAVQEMLADPARAQVMLVTLPETTPVSEAIETAYALEERVGVALGPIVVNAVDEGAELPDPARLDAAAPAEVRDALAFRRARRALHRRELARLERELGLPQVRLPHLSSPALGPDEIATLAAALLTSAAEQAA